LVHCCSSSFFFIFHFSGTPGRGKGQGQYQQQRKTSKQSSGFPGGGFGGFPGGGKQTKQQQQDSKETAKPKSKNIFAEIAHIEEINNLNFEKVVQKSNISWLFIIDDGCKFLKRH
jgi:hypothetical protein